MVADGETEADPRLLKAAGLDGDGGVDVDPEHLENLCRASAGPAAVAVLGDAEAAGCGGGGDEGGRCGNIECFGCPAGSACVDDRNTVVGCGHGLDAAAHGPGGAEEFVFCDAAALDQGEHGGGLGLVVPAFEEAVENRLGLGVRERAALQEHREELIGIHRLGEGLGVGARR